MGVVIADKDLIDVTELIDCSFEVAFGEDENSIEFKADPLYTPPINGYIYIDGTEYGGTVDEIKASTARSGIRSITATGRSWHGILAGKRILADSGKAKLTVSGNVSDVLSSLIARLGLSALFEAPSTESDASYINSYSFDRLVDAYTGIKAMLKANSLKLTMRHASGKVLLGAKAVVDYGSKVDSDLLDFDITSINRCTNHLVCGGTGENEDRTVIHFYADKDGNVSHTQSLFGVDEIVGFYDYPNADEEKLEEEGAKKLKDLQGQGTVEVDVHDDLIFDVGDIVSARDNSTGLLVSAPITKKIVEFDYGITSYDYEAGNATTGTSNSTYSGSGESSGGGHAYYAGSGISISNYTISADVTQAKLDAVSTTATLAYTTASNASAAAGEAQEVAAAASETAEAAQSTAGNAQEAADAAQEAANTAQTTADGKADANHTHLYAGSETAGGVANSALKLSNTAAIGSTSKGVYFTANGVPAVLSASVGNATRPVYYKSGVPGAITSVAVAYGGTGATTAAAALTNLGAAAKSHTHAKADITDFPTSMPASDVSAWAKASTKPSYDFSELTGTVDATSKLSGVIPAENLPSYVDDVLEYAGIANFPATGETGKIYVDTTTNKTYRWSGTGYVVISETIALGETSSTAYRGDRGKIAYDHSQTTGNPHGTTKANLGLGNVENKSSETIREELTKANVTTALGYTPPTTNTTYSTGSTTTSGLTKLYTSTGTATDGAMTQSAITTQLSGKAASSHTHTVDDVTGTLSITKGGTGGTTAAEARTNLVTLGAKSMSNHWGLTAPDGDESDYVRSPKGGFLPHTKSTNGYGYLGTAVWPWANLHCKNLYGNTFTGNSASATKLQTARTVAITGAVSGSATFDGSSDITITVTGDSAAANFLAAHPVGSIYETTVSDNPATLYGGTWIALPSVGAFIWERTA